MSTPTPTPTRIEPLPPSEIRIHWTDGTEYALPYFDLRFDCPCAFCVDEHTGRRILRAETIRKDIRVIGVQPVGRYAVQLRWSDGHGTGVHPFDRLHALCLAKGRKLEPGE